MGKPLSDNMFTSRIVTYKDDGTTSLRLFMAILQVGCQLLNSRRLCVVDEGTGLGSWVIELYIRKRDIQRFEELSGLRMDVLNNRK